MRKIISLILIISIFSCKTKSVKTVVKNTSGEQPKQIASSFDNLIGAYSGNLGANKIALLISNIYKDSFSGRFIIGDSSSDISGVIKVKNGKYDIITSDKIRKNNEGAFNFIINGNADSVKALWLPSSNQNIVSNTDYVLKRKAFEYNPVAGEYKASQKLLYTSDVENLMKNELEIMRNEIFARHGYCFTKNDMREYFENENWYVPNSKDIRNNLTATEIKNIMLIKRFEKYADEHGDDFGR